MQVTYRITTVSKPQGEVTNAFSLLIKNLWDNEYSRLFLAYNANQVIQCFTVVSGTPIVRGNALNFLNCVKDQLGKII